MSVDQICKRRSIDDVKIRPDIIIVLMRQTTVIYKRSCGV